MIRRFTARYDSDCNQCGSAIYEGDEAGYIDDVVCCDNCCDEADED